MRISEGAQSLNGTWKFKYFPALNAAADENFFQPTFDVAAWKTISVPSHWELQGFAEPQYGDDVKEGTGLYRRTFRVPKNWQGQRVFLRFDGVLYGFTVFVNGKPVGEWASGYNAATFDITDALRGDADNVLAVPSTQSEFRWLGQGPYAGYPGNDRLNEYGIFHLNRDDLYFHGNRRGVELAALTAPSGAGVLLSGNGMTLEVERANDTTIFSHLTLVPGQSSSSKSAGDEVAISSKLKVQSIKTIAGAFKLLPLDTNWRAPLTQWFGAPDKKAVSRKAYYWSYDQ